MATKKCSRCKQHKEATLENFDAHPAGKLLMAAADYLIKHGKAVG